VTLITGIIGIAMVVAFLGTLVWWIKALPFTIIVVGVLLLLLYDFITTLRAERGGQ
jgi:hypothetical protein